MLVGTNRPFRFLSLISPGSIIHLRKYPQIYSDDIPSSQSPNDPCPRNRRMTDRNHILQLCLKHTTRTSASSLPRHLYDLARLVRGKCKHTCRNSLMHRLRPRHTNSSKWRRHRLCMTPISSNPQCPILDIQVPVALSTSRITSIVSREKRNATQSKA